MKLINFDAHFTETLNQWIEKNADRFAKPDDMEEEVPGVYARWLEKPAKWLGGATPAEYFKKYTDSKELCDLMCRYIDEEVDLPDLLLDRLQELGDEKVLMELAANKKAPCAARMAAIELLRQLESKLPMTDFIRWQVDREDEEDILDNALESLRQMGDEVVKPAKVAFLAAGQEGKEALLDVLADYPGDEDVFGFALQQFKTQTDKRALYAGYLAKLEDDHALEALLDVAESDDVSYIDFIEIRSAIERLGADAPVRDWSDDPTYKAFMRMQPKGMPKGPFVR